MSDNISNQNRQKFHSQIKKTRQLYQFFLKTTAQIFVVNSRSRSAIFRRVTKAVTADRFEVEKQTFDRITERYLNYRQNQTRFNFHMRLHYDVILTEYDQSSQCNAFIEENKHRYFKKIIMFINFRNVEYNLLNRENVQQIIRFVLNDDYSDTESEFTAILNDLRKQCSSLFAFVLFRTEQHMKSDENENDEFTAIMNDINHKRSAVFERLSSKYCQMKFRLSI